MTIFSVRPRLVSPLLIAFNIFFLIFLLVLFPDPVRAEPLVTIFYTGNSLGQYKACPT